MSLVLWLPLNGNLENKGISQMPPTFTSVNAVYGTGKTTALAYDTSIPSTSAVCPGLVGLTTFSIAYWAKIKEEDTFSNWADLWALMATTNGQSAMRIRAERQNTTYPDREGLYMTKDTTMGSNTNNYYSAGTIDTQYQWYHTVMVKTPSQVKVYRNGVLTNTRDCSTYEIVPVTLTGTVVLGLAGSQAYLNDFRVYNHALSAAEVKEIAQGLVLHYKLDSIGNGPNLITTVQSSTVTLTGTEYTNAYTASWYLNSDIKNNQVLKENTVVTVVYDYTVNTLTYGSAYLYSQFNGSRLTSPSQTNTAIRTNTSGRCIETFKLTAAQANSTASNYYLRFRFYANGGDSVTISNVQLYFGDKSTLNIIEDSSGYQNHGRAYNNPIISTNTPRYSASTYFNGSNAYIVCSSAAKRKDVMTVNLWVYKDTETQANSLISCSYGTSGGWEIAFNNNHIRYRVVIGTSSRMALGYTAPTELNYGWNMITGTYENRTAKLYINGEFITQSSADTTYDDVIYYVTNNLLIGATGTSDSNVPPTSFFQGNISDVRIYCTSLLDTDIKQLYNVGMKVDKSQNIHAFEFAEQNGATQFKHTGVIETAQVSDDLLFDKKAHIGKKSYPNILENTIDIITTKDSNIKKGTITSISAEQVQALAGKTLRLTYDVCADGDRSSTENGQTAYNYIRYGIHGSMAYTNSSGTTGTAYPFAGFLTYSGPATHAVQTWTIPSGYQTYGPLNFSIQNFDSPASTNNAIWFIQNVRLEVIESTSNGFVTGTQLIER